MGWDGVAEKGRGERREELGEVGMGGARRNLVL